MFLVVGAVGYLLSIIVMALVLGSLVVGEVIERWQVEGARMQRLFLLLPYVGGLTLAWFTIGRKRLRNWRRTD